MFVWPYRRSDNAIHRISIRWIKLYVLPSLIRWIPIYLLDSIVRPLYNWALDFSPDAWLKVPVHEYEEAEKVTDKYDENLFPYFDLQLRWESLWFYMVTTQYNLVLSLYSSSFQYGFL